MSTFNSSLISRVGSPPRDNFMTKNSNDQNINHNNWTKWTNNLQNVVDSSDYYGFPSICLNSDFNFMSGVPASITQGDGDGALWAQLWSIHGAAVATYTISHSNYASTDYDPTGSLYYVNFNISNYTGNGSLNDFYGYQEQDGLQFLLQFENRIISLSCLVNNLQSKSINAKLQIYFYFNGSTPRVYDGNTFQIPPGISEVSDQITTDDLSQYTVGASPYVQFRLVFCDLGDATANINLSYIKAEISDNATVLYVDHFLEQTRIANF